MERQLASSREAVDTIGSDEHVNALGTCANDVANEAEERRADEEPSPSENVRQPTDQSEADSEPKSPGDGYPSDIRRWPDGGIDQSQCVCWKHPSQVPRNLS